MVSFLRDRRLVKNRSLSICMVKQCIEWSRLVLSYASEKHSFWRYQLTREAIIALIRFTDELWKVGGNALIDSRMWVRLSFSTALGFRSKDQQVKGLKEF